MTSWTYTREDFPPDSTIVREEQYITNYKGADRMAQHDGRSLGGSFLFFIRKKGVVKAGQRLVCDNLDSRDVERRQILKICSSPPTGRRVGNRILT
jgi:hypothetical protein